MGMVAILVIRPESFEQTFVPSSHWGCHVHIWLNLQKVSSMKPTGQNNNRWMTFDFLALNDPAVSEKMFEECGQWTK